MTTMLKRLNLTASFAALLLCLAPAVRVHAAKADVYAGYSRVGSNLYSPYTPGMNGWQLTAHVKPLPFVGVEGDVSHYGASAGAGSQSATLVMFGPRVTVGAAGLSVFAHGLAGVAHFSSDAVAFLPSVGYNATSYALGAGADLPVLLSFKLRITGDYLGNSQAPSSRYAPSHYRFGVGLAYHF